MTSASPRQAQRASTAVLAAAFLFNLGQGVLRPAMPLYLQRTFQANYRMVTLIPAVFGAGKWVANLPAGYLLSRFGLRLMIGGLLLIALVDVASIAASEYAVFVGLRAVGGMGWAMFATVATTTMVNLPAVHRRGRAVSLLLMSETAGLLVGSAAGGWLYERAGIVSPFLFEAGCMLVAAAAVGGWRPPPATGTKNRSAAIRNRHLFVAVIRTPGVLLMGLTNALLTALQTGVLVFLFPLYLVTRGGVGAEAVGLIVSLGVLGRLMAVSVGGSLSDRWGRMRMLIPGLLIYAVSLASMSRVTHPAILGACSLAVGAAAGFVAAIPTALIGDRVEPALHGVAIGWLRTMSDSGQIAGPLVMGAVADAVDLSTAFLLGAILLVVTAWGCRRHTADMAASTSTKGPKS